MTEDTETTMTTKNDVVEITPGTIYRIDFKEDTYEPEIDDTLLATGRDGVTSALESIIRTMMGIGWSNPDYTLNRMRHDVELAASRVAYIEVNGGLAEKNKRRAVEELARLKADAARAEFVIEFLNNNDAITADTPVDADDERLLDVFRNGATPIALNLFHTFLFDLERYQLDLFIPVIHGRNN